MVTRPRPGPLWVGVEPTAPPPGPALPPPPEAMPPPGRTPWARISSIIVARWAREASARCRVRWRSASAVAELPDIAAVAFSDAIMDDRSKGTAQPPRPGRVGRPLVVFGTVY